MRGAAPRKAQKTKEAQYKDLAKLGKYLSASDVKGTDVTRKRESAKREAGLKDAYLSKRGGGQGKAVPTSRMLASTKRETNATGPKTPRMNVQQKREFLSGAKVGVLRNKPTGTWNVSAKGNRKQGK